MVTHVGIHLDELLALYMALKSKHSLFRFNPDYVTEEICVGVEDGLEKEHPGILFLGLGGGRFDDHGKSKDYSCCQLMADYLGIEDEPLLIKLIETVSKQDKKGSSIKDRRTLPWAVNIMNRYGASPDVVREFVFKAFDVLIESERVLLEEIRADLKERGFNRSRIQEALREEFISTPRPWYHLTLNSIAKKMGEREGERWTAVVDDAFEKQKTAFDLAEVLVKERIHTEYSSEFGRLKVLCIDGIDGRYKDCEKEIRSASRKNNVHVFVIRSSVGNTIIGVNRCAEFNLRDFLGLLRKAELDARGIAVDPSEDLCAEGTLSSTPSWHCHEGIGFTTIMNGSLTRPCIEPTELGFWDIVSLLRESVGIEVEEYYPQQVLVTG